jgi:ParB/RepB/Spo0J family partition protein
VSAERVGRVCIDLIDYHRHNVRVDLGDLRDLVDSIKRFGIMQPVVLEQRGQRFRIRAGHRRVAAARLAGLDRVPAIIHDDALEDDEWLTAAVHENTRRRSLDRADRARTVEAMRKVGMRWEAIADALGVAPATARRLVRADLRTEGGVDEEKRDRLAAQIDSMTREGLSARQIGVQLRVTPRTVARYRTGGGRSVSCSTVRAFAQEARVRVESGQWGAQDVIDAALRLADERTLRAALVADLQGAEVAP